MHKEDLILTKPYAECKELDSTRTMKNNDDVLRIYCTQYPRPNWKKCKSRNMIATVGLNIDEVRKILASMESTKIKGA